MFTDYEHVGFSSNHEYELIIVLMRFYKVLLHLIVLVCVVITIYVFQTDNSNSASFFREKDSEIRLSNLYDVSKKSLPATMINETLKQSSKIISKHNFMDYSIWCIFTKVKHTNAPLRYKFERFINSLMKHSSVVITLNVISDNSSQIIAESVIKKCAHDTGKIIKVIFCK